MDDQRQTTSTSLQGKETLTRNYTVGISETTPFGLQAKASYSVTETDIKGASSSLVQTPRFFDAKPQLELTQSLWRNGFGAETRATQEQIESQALFSSHSENYKRKGLLAEAEGIYWRLVQSREMLLMQKESLKRAQKIRDWALRRANLQLGDHSDLLQAEAALKLKALELRAAMDEEHGSARQFNSFRGIENDSVSESLLELPMIDFKTIETPPRADFREDVLAVKEQSRSVQAATRVAVEKNSPILELFANLSLNGRNKAFSESHRQSWTSDHPVYVVGIRFSTPLHFGVMKDTMAGYHKEKQASVLVFQRKAFEQQQEWRDLSRKLSETKARLELSVAIEKAQQEKLSYEKTRHSKGRTTTYQVLLFEQDFANAQLNRIRVQGDILRIIAQMKTFSGKAGS